jgi:hypothetical protein
MARRFLSRDGPLLRPMSVRYYAAPEVDGPDGIGTIQQDGGSGGWVAIRLNIMCPTRVRRNR